MKGLLLLPKEPAKEEVDEPVMDEGSYDEGLVDTASDVLAAQSQGDAAGFAMSLKSFINQCLLDHERSRD